MPNIANKQKQSLRVAHSDDCEWCVVLCTGSCSSECCEKEKVVSRKIESTLTPKERAKWCEEYGEKAEKLRQRHKLRAKVSGLQKKH